MQHSSSGWDKGRAEVVEVLHECARAQGTISYSELSERLRSIVIPHDGPEMTAMLDEVSIAEFKAGRGMLSVVVVHKIGDQMPGPGFFKTAKELGNTVIDKEAFWIGELLRVHRYWSGA